MKASLIFYPNSAKRNESTARTPVYMRVNKDRQKAECRLVIELSESELANWDEITMRIRERNSAANHVLNQFENRFHNFLLSHALDIGMISAKDIRDALLGKASAALSRSLPALSNLRVKLR